MSQTTAPVGTIEHVPSGQVTLASADSAALESMPADQARRMWNTCKVLARTPQLAEPLRDNPAAVLGLALYLDGFGIPLSLVTLSKIHVWREVKNEKQPDGSWREVETGRIMMQEHYQLMLGLIHRAGHDAYLKSLDDTSATFGFIHRDHPGREQTFTYTMAMAERAGLANKNNWKKHPHYMLPAAAVRMTARLGCPEVLVGLDLGDGDMGEREIQPVRPPAAAIGTATQKPADGAWGDDRPAQAVGGSSAPQSDEGSEPGPSGNAQPATPAPSNRPSPIAKAIHTIAGKAGVSDAVLGQIIAGVTGDPSANSITIEHAPTIIDLVWEASDLDRPADEG